MPRNYFFGGSLNVGDWICYRARPDIMAIPSILSGVNYSQHIGFAKLYLKGTVISKNSNGKIVVALEIPKSSITLKGYDGYNNGVQMLHCLCDKLYSEPERYIKVGCITSADLSKEDESSYKHGFDNGLHPFLADRDFWVGETSIISLTNERRYYVSACDQKKSNVSSLMFSTAGVKSSASHDVQPVIRLGYDAIIGSERGIGTYDSPWLLERG